MFHYRNGGVCQAVRSSDTKKYHPKCACPSNRAGLECERPNLCLNRCLNGGRCVSDQEGHVSCICPHGLQGSRCEAKTHFDYIDADNNDDDDTKGINKTVVDILLGTLTILAIVSLAFGIVYVYKKTRLGAAFKHRRMAENLLSNNAEFANQMFMPEEDEGGIPMSVSTNFSNPVYESMYEDPNEASIALSNEATGLLNHDNNPECMIHDPDQIESQSLHDEESVDLLTEKHRGNISL